jgi:hypothetical protein
MFSSIDGDMQRVLDGDGIQDAYDIIELRRDIIPNLRIRTGGVAAQLNHGQQGLVTCLQDCINMVRTELGSEPSRADKCVLPCDLKKLFTPSNSDQK